MNLRLYISEIKKLMHSIKRH